MSKFEFYLGLQGTKKPNEYISIAKACEENGFDRIYVYDDLLYYPTFPILTTIAHYTEKIKIAPCLVNGFYRHPAVIASNFAYLSELSNNRTLLGMGRGAFFDILEMDNTEQYTREGYEEAVQLVKHFISHKRERFDGKFFKATEKAFIKTSLPPEPYLITGTWNKDMAYTAGKYCRELQVAEVWNKDYILDLWNAFKKGNEESNSDYTPKISIGGMVCVGKTEAEAIAFAKSTIVVYMPYFETILKSHNINIEEKYIQDIFNLSQLGKFKEAAKLLPDELAKSLALVGTSEQIVDKINSLREEIPINGLLMSPPYGTEKDIVSNIKLISKEIIPKLR